MAEQMSSRASLFKRSGGSSPSKAAIIAVIVVFIVLLVAISAYGSLRAIRVRHSNSKYIPTRFLKRKWEAWEPKSFISSRGKYNTPSHQNGSVPTLHLRSENRSARNSAFNLPDVERAQVQETTENDTNVDRRESVRSVMTLPTYSRSVRDNERVLGKEGDRDGIDVVLEQPETQDEEEAIREEEMESLYQIRLQRRQELAERDDRRQRRREARARGDNAAIAAIREETRLRAEEMELTGASAMIVDHQARVQSRERRVSSVSYAELGVARHDGSRLRANSGESDRPLLGSAASIGGGSTRPWLSRDSTDTHRRAASSGSAISVSDNEAEVEIPFGRSGSDFEIVNMNQGAHSRNASRNTDHTRSRSRASSISGSMRPSVDTTTLEGDLGGGGIPANSPPGYAEAGFEEAPPYTSPIHERAAREVPPQRPQHERSYSRTGAPLLPEISRLPSIRVADPTPVDQTRTFDWPPASQLDR